MNWVLFVARRYLRAKRNTRFLSLSTALSMGGIGLGVSAIVVVLSVMSGFEKQLREKLVTNDLHVLITPKPEYPSFEMGRVKRSELDSSPALASLTTSKGVLYASYQLSTEVVIRSGNKVSGVQIKGVESERLKKVKSTLVEEALPQMLVDREGAGAHRYPGLFVGRELAYDMGLIPGDFVTLISPSEMDGPFSTIPRMKRFIIEGIYKMGVPEQESQIVFASLNQVESFLRVRNQVSEIELSLKNAEDSPELVNRFRNQLSGLRIQDWNDLNSNLFASMRLERIAMFLILLFTVVISSLNIVSTLMLLVQEKLKEIAIFRTMGARSRDIQKIFMWKGILIGGTGVVFGGVIATLVCIVLKKFHFISLPEVYYDRTLPVNFDMTYFIGVPVISFLIVILASFFPARRAGKLSPLDGMREY